MQDALQAYLDTNKMHHFEGQRGVDHMEKVMREVCGYKQSGGGVMVDFFADNPGAMEAVIEWIGMQRVSEWVDNLKKMESGEIENNG